MTRGKTMSGEIVLTEEGKRLEASRVAAAQEVARAAAQEVVPVVVAPEVSEEVVPEEVVPEEVAPVVALVGVSKEEADRAAAQRAQVEAYIRNREKNPGQARLTRPVYQTNATNLSSGLSRQQRDARDEERYRHFLETHFSEGIMSDQYPGRVFANTARNIPVFQNPSENSGGKKQKKRNYTQTRTRQKKQHRRRRRRHSTRKYRK
jgi:hypothetical protein